MHHLHQTISVAKDSHQYAYGQNFSTADPISAVIRLALSDVENKDSYARLLFLDFSFCIQRHHSAEAHDQAGSIRYLLASVYVGPGFPDPQATESKNQ